MISAILEDVISGNMYKYTNATIELSCRIFDDTTPSHQTGLTELIRKMMEIRELFDMDLSRYSNPHLYKYDLMKGKHDANLNTMLEFWNRLMFNPTPTEFPLSPSELDLLEMSIVMDRVLDFPKSTIDSLRFNTLCFFMFPNWSHETHDEEFGSTPNLTYAQDNLDEHESIRAAIAEKYSFEENELSFIDELRTIAKHHGETSPVISLRNTFFERLRKQFEVMMRK